ncbi:FIST C-terminal domain-containing protein [Rheinheimera sp. YQF-2]|uniref:FIST C-terminal domain-containing protein n=1 Tax=Rheinheimera lutimaris TaxID=2740584 RepID=A0A7Y5AQK3_9GAMM|nr:FIST C-terminal domain-containing protein [Rheinheimera lutimaris]NRQ42717.1 FIST C-terminal domain-containing protein [Rheinheimera lutimaris]
MKVIRHYLDVTDQACFCDQLVALEQPETASLSIAFGSTKAITELSSCHYATMVSAGWVATSSCRDAFSDRATESNHHLAILQFVDPNGAYGVASRHSNSKTIVEDSKAALEEALLAANKPGELPAFIWCSPSPGLEEGLLTGIRELIGNDVPVFGGSSADNDISGNWCMFDGKQLINTGFIIAVMFPSVPISYYFSCGYEQTTLSAVVTGVSERQLITLDNQPAADVYNNWRALNRHPPLPAGPVLAASTFSPLGRIVPQHDINMALLSHPARIRTDGSIDLFSRVHTGECITFMQGDTELLVQRAATVSDIARQQLSNLYDSKPQAAIVIFCAGCMLAIPDDIKRVHQGIRQKLENIPFIGGYTFGEQGRFADGINRHGNLMISAIIFGSVNESV